MVVVLVVIVVVEAGALATYLVLLVGLIDMSSSPPPPPGEFGSGAGAVSGVSDTLDHWSKEVYISTAPSAGRHTL